MRILLPYFTLSLVILPVQPCPAQVKDEAAKVKRIAEVQNEIHELQEKISKLTAELNKFRPVAATDGDIAKLLAGKLQQIGRRDMTNDFNKDGTASFKRVTQEAKPPGDADITKLPVAIAFSAGAQPAPAKLPERVAKAIKEAFPDEAVAKAGKIGTDEWEIAVGEKGQKIVRTGPTRALESILIVSISTAAKEADLPEKAAQAFKTAEPKAKIVEVIRHELRAEPTGSRRLTYRQLATPKFLFTVAYVKEENAKRYSLTVDMEGNKAFFRWTESR